jgi:hypothetical protein
MDLPILNEYPYPISLNSINSTQTTQIFIDMPSLPPPAPSIEIATLISLNHLNLYAYSTPILFLSPQESTTLQEMPFLLTKPQ